MSWTLCFWRRPRASVFPSLPLVRTLCVVGASTQALVPYLRALCYCFGACTQVGSLVFSLCSRCVAVCGGFIADLAKQWRKNCGGVSEAGETDLFIYFVVFCVVFLLFLAISLARARPPAKMRRKGQKKANKINKKVCNSRRKKLELMQIRVEQTRDRLWVGKIIFRIKQFVHYGFGEVQEMNKWRDNLHHNHVVLAKSKKSLHRGRNKLELSKFRSSDHQIGCG